MAEQIIDIRERIEKMRIKFEDDQKSDSNDVSIDEKKDTINLTDKSNDYQNEEIKYNKNNDLPKSNNFTQNKKEFPSVQLSVKNPISSKILVFLMLLQVFSNVGIFMLL